MSIYFKNNCLDTGKDKLNKNDNIHKIEAEEIIRPDKY